MNEDNAFIDASEEDIKAMLGEELQAVEMDDSIPAVIPSIFHEVLGMEYGNKFRRIYNAKLEDKADLMQELYASSIDDDKLSDDHKHIIEECNRAFRDAMFLDGHSETLLNTANNHHKFFKRCRTKVFKRLFDDIYSFVQLSKIPMSYSYIYKVPKEEYINIIKAFVPNMTNISKEQVTMFATEGLLLYGVLAEFISNSSMDTRVQDIWFVMMLLQFFLETPYTTDDYMSEMRPRVTNMIYTIKSIVTISNTISEQRRSIKNNR